MKKQEINEAFINELRLDLGTTNWIFDNTEPVEIVPEVLMHSYLLRNFIIDESIYKYYHLPTSNLLSDIEFQKMKDTKFCGEKETALQPYSNIIYGAYYSRSDLVWKLSGIAFMQKPNIIEGKEIKYFTDLIPYFKEYAKGFANGFNEFDNTQIKPFLTMLAEKQDYVNKVFEYITKYLLFKHSWVSGESGFATNQNKEIVNAFENGQQQGYFYRAWSIVFSNNNLFAPLFREHLKELPSQPININESRKYTAKHYVLAYLFECNAKGESFPIGNKIELEKIGYRRTDGAINGNTFYKAFNWVVNKDLNIENNLIEIGGEYWRKAVLELSQAPELVETYLKTKQL